MSKRKWRVCRSILSSSRVSRSKSNVPTPASRMTCATYWSRRLWRLLPLPCAKRTRPSARPGTLNSPGSVMESTGINTSREIAAFSSCSSPKLYPACIFNHFLRPPAAHSDDATRRLRRFRSLLPYPAAAWLSARARPSRALNGFGFDDNKRCNFS
jgi:hypothetical protein